MTTVNGKGLISAKIIADSVCWSGDRLTTYELEYPRFIHSEFMTHCMLAKNAASSRAIPIKAMHKHILENPQGPIEWGLNQPGMQAKQLMTPLQAASAQAIWDNARDEAVRHSMLLDQAMAHKQTANRITEPFMQMKVVCSGTEWDNFFWLRNHEDAQPEIHELARCMQEANDMNEAQWLAPGEWHLPYISTSWNSEGEVEYSTGDLELTLDQAKAVSASCCAQVSYRKNDESLEKALMIYDRLVNSTPIHASPFEHQGTPISPMGNVLFEPESWEQGITHVKRDGTLWSAKFQGWIQHRQLIPNQSK